MGSAAIAFSYPDDIDAVLDGLEAFVRVEVIDRYKAHADLLDDVRRRYGPDGAYVPEVVDLIRAIRTASAAAGYFNLAVPASMGGGGMGHLAYYAAWEHVYHVCGGVNWLAQFALSHWAFGPSAVLERVTERATNEILPGLMAGETMMCFGMSEPDAGSDATMLRTRAEPDGDGWLLSGRKIWTTHVPIADWMIVLAITDPERARARRGGISAFLVPTTAPGFRIERIIGMWGEPGGPEAESVLEDVRVEPWQLVGELHEGFQIGLQGVSLGRVYNAARAVGLSRWAIEEAVEYTKSRQTFGKAISEYQGVSFPLATAATEIHAAHLMGLNASALLDQGHRAIKELSMAKAYAVQAGVRAVDRAIQTFGAVGFTNEMGLTEAYHTLRVINVADGTNEILNRTIFQRLLGGDLDLQRAVCYATLAEGNRGPMSEQHDAVRNGDFNRERVAFHFDVMCPWAYQASVWIRDVRAQRGLQIDWRFFSLEEINRSEGKKHPWERAWSYGWGMMRVAALLRRTSMDDCDRFYAVAGRALHVEGRKPHRPEVAAELLASIGLDPGLVDEAVADETTHDDVRRDHDAVASRGGFGVPTLVFDDDSHLYGPVITPAPLGDDALALWDLVAATRRFPHLYELKRPKTDADIAFVAEQFAPYLSARDWETRERPAR